MLGGRLVRRETIGLVLLLAVLANASEAQTQPFSIAAGSIPSAREWVRRDAAAPAERRLAAAAYDSIRGRVVLFGGQGLDGKFYNDTWDWDGAVWRNRTANGAVGSPSARASTPMVFDPIRKKLVLFGGVDGGVPNVRNDTWEYDGTNWTNPQANGVVGAPEARTEHAMGFDPVRGRVLLFGGTNGSSVRYNDLWEWNGTTWAPIAATNPPPKRNGHSLAYNSATGKFVLFGGVTDGDYLNDTWELNGTNWSQVATTGGPPPKRDGRTLAYDSTTGRVVLFGGLSTSRLDDTWELDGTTWTQRNPATRPSARAYPSLVYDPVRGKMVLFGGETDSGFAGETWEYSYKIGGTPTWTLCATIAPPPPKRESHGMVYDSTRQRIVLFGGKDGTTGKQDTWEWSGSNWTQVASTGPTGRGGFGMAFDPVRKRIVVFGGAEGGVRKQDTWEWDGLSWSQKATTGPSARVDTQMAYDAASGKVLLFGGDDGVNLKQDTWQWDGSNWSQVNLSGTSPGPRSRHAMASDSTRQRIVLFGGSTSDLADTWEWDGTAWSQRSPAGTAPAGRELSRMEFDSARGEMVLFAGRDGETNAQKSDTWEWNGSRWREVPSAGGPDARYAHGMAYDPVGARLVLFGGYSVDSRQDTWEFDGTRWTMCSTGASPSPLRRYEHGMSYDSSRGKVVLFGGLNNSAVQQDTWEWNGAGWTQVSTTGPSARYGFGMTYAAHIDRTVLFGGVDSSSVKGDTWVWNGANWTAFSNVRGPDSSVRLNAQIVHDSSRSKVVLFGGSQGRGETVEQDTWEWNGSDSANWVRALDSGPPARWRHQMCYDRLRGRVVLFGGGSDIRLGDTWEWNGTTEWGQKAGGPPTRALASLEFDTVRGKSILFGGGGDSATANDTWEWDGTTWMQTFSGGPQAREQHKTAYDEGRGMLVLFGGYSGGGSQGSLSLGDTWELASNRSPTVSATFSSAGGFFSPGKTVTLSATASDPDLADVLKYRWIQTHGPRVELITPTAHTATFSTPFTSTATGVYGFQVAVRDEKTDGQARNGHAYSLGTVTITNPLPTASASASAAVTGGNQDTRLDGTASSDPEGDTLTYSWTAESTPVGARVTFGLNNSAAAAVTSFNGDKTGPYVIRLTVTDRLGGSSSTTTAITVDATRPRVLSLSYSPSTRPQGRQVFTAPAASAGPASIRVDFGENVLSPRLDLLGVAQSGPIGLSGRSLPLAMVSTGIYSASFSVALTDVGLYNVRVSAADEAGNTTEGFPADGQFQVNKTPTVIVSSAPIPGTTGVIRELIGSRIDDDGTATGFRWTLEAPLPAGSSLSSQSIQLATGTAPDDNPSESFFTPDVPGTFLLRLAADDGLGGRASATLSVVVSAVPVNQPPIADAGADLMASTGRIVTLDGSGSFDPGASHGSAGITSYSWSFVSFPSGFIPVLDRANTSRARFTPTIAGDYVLRLAIKDTQQVGAFDDVRVTVRRDEPNTTGEVVTTLMLGASRDGTLDTSDDVDVFAFDTRLDFVYDVEVSAIAPLFARAELIRDERNPIRPPAPVDVSPGTSQALRGFRPTQKEDRGPERIFIRILSPDNRSSGNYSVRVTERAETADFVPQVSLNLSLADPDEPVAVFSTAGTSVPISFFSVFVQYDGRSLSAQRATPLGTGVFSFEAPQLAPPSIALDFQSPTERRAALPAGNLARVLFRSLTRFPDDSALLASILEVQANAGTNVVVRRPTADAGVDRQLRLASASASLPVTLDGTRSIDGGRDVIRSNTPEPSRSQLNLRFRWTQIGSEPESVQLEGANSASPVFRPRTEGRYRFRLVVDNGVITSSPDDVEIVVRFNRLEPSASLTARVRQAKGPELVVSAQSGDITSAPLLVQSPATIQLDGSGSIDPDRVGGQVLRYAWTQVEGPPVKLSNPTSVISTFVRPDPVSLQTAGRYVFQLITEDADGLESRAARLAISAAPSIKPAPTLSVTAQAADGGLETPDLGDIATLSRAEGLRLDLSPTTGTKGVRLTARAVDNSGGLLQFVWVQTAGPETRLDVRSSASLLRTTSATVILRQPGVYEFECTVRQVSVQQIDGREVVTATAGEARRKVRIVTQDVPRAAVAGDGTVVTGSVIRLSSTISQSRPGVQAAYLWTQIEGPPVNLSDPTAAVTTFVAIAFDGKPQRYVFQHFVDDGLRSAPLPLVVDTVLSGSEPPSGLLTLTPGMNLVGLPIEPRFAGTNAPWKVSDLMQATGADFVAWIPAGSNRFKVLTRNVLRNDEPVSGNIGYLVVTGRAGTSIPVTGATWPAGLVARSLSKGLNLVAFPRGVPIGGTAATLASSTGASYVIQAESRNGRRPVLVPFVPLLTPAWSLRANGSYILSVPTTRSVELKP